MSSYIGLYGSIKLIKDHCTACGSLSFVIDGVSACCQANQCAQPTSYHRESPGPGTRKRPPLEFCLKQLALQGHRCFYCDHAFQCIVYRHTRRVKLQVRWDHMLPFVYLQGNPTHNFVAACQVCNGIKGDMCFATIEEACHYVKRRWGEKGYRDDPPDMPYLRQNIYP